MAVIITLANKYRKRPSEIMGIDDDYLAYLFDETALFLEQHATDEKGRIDWNRINWKGENNREKTTNQKLIEFIQRHK